MCFTVPSRVTEVLSPFEAEVDRAGVRLKVSTMLLEEPIAVGDWVMVQAQRQAVGRLDADEAANLLTLYQEILYQLEGTTP